MTWLLIGGVIVIVCGIWLAVSLCRAAAQGDHDTERAMAATRTRRPLESILGQKWDADTQVPRGTVCHTFSPEWRASLILSEMTGKDPKEIARAAWIEYNRLKAEGRIVALETPYGTVVCLTAPLLNETPAEAGEGEG